MFIESSLNETKTRHRQSEGESEDPNNTLSVDVKPFKVVVLSPDSTEAMSDMFVWPDS